jgi:hypothetical protein
MLRLMEKSAYVIYEWSLSALDPMHRRNIETYPEKEVGKQSDATQRRNFGRYFQVLSLLYIIPVEYWAP